MSLANAYDLEAGQAAVDAVAGERTVRKLIVVGVAVIGGFFLFFGGWAVLGRLDSAVMAVGVVGGHRQVVQHPDGGVVQAIWVKEGQFVSKGQALLRLDPVQTQAVLDVQTSAVDGLRAQVARLEAEQAGAAAVVFPADLLSRQSDPRVAEAIRTQAELFAARRGALSGAGGTFGEQMAQARAESAGVEGQLKALDQQYALVQDELAGMRKLYEKGFAPKSRVLALERAAASVQGQRDEYIGRLGRFRHTVGQLQAQTTQLDRERRSEVSLQLQDARGRLAEAEERLRVARDMMARTFIRAPVSGYVLNLNASTVGGVIGRGEIVLEVVPSGGRPVIEAKLKPVDGEHVRKGMKTELRLTSPNGRRMPKVAGVIEQRSADLVVDPKTGAAYYKVSVAVDPEDLARVPGMRLTPGTPVEITAPTGSRSPIDYLLAPVTDSFRHGLREQ